MKLRIQGNSLRLRLLRSEVAKVADGACLEEQITLAPNATLSYTLSVSLDRAEPTVAYEASRITVTIPAQAANVWAYDTQQVGIYATLNQTGGHPLDLSIEKDFACLDLSDADNHDTFQNPAIGATC